MSAESTRKEMVKEQAKKKYRNKRGKACA